MDKKNETEEEKRILLDWKTSYLELLIDALQPFGDVLQVGFGLDDSATRIQNYKPKSHTIIESDSQIAGKAKLWGSKYENVKIIQDSWQNGLSQLGSFDIIFFNDYPLESEKEILGQLNPEEASAITSNAKTVLEQLEKKISQTTTPFSDKEISDFYQKIGKFNVNELTKFLRKLKDKGNISNIQYEKAIKEYQLEDDLKIYSESDTKQAEPMLLFLLECIKNHMRQGSRFSSFLPVSKSKYEDSIFFDRIITTPELDYTENVIPIKMSNGKTREALLFIVKKVG